MSICKDVTDTALTAIQAGATQDQVFEAVHARANGASRQVEAPRPPADEPMQETSRSLAELLSDPELLNPRPRIPTTFTALDVALAGGFVERGMYILAGLTGRGKSTLTANLARRVASSGVPTLWITLEDEDLASARKLVAQEAGVPILALENYQKPGAISESQRERITATLSRLAKLPLRIDSVTSDLVALEVLVERWVSRGTRLVLIDQSSWVHAECAKTPFEEASTVARHLKILAKRLQITILVLVQVNRAGAASVREGSDLELFHIRDTGKWEEDADAVLIIQSIDEASNDTALMRIDLKKNRRGKSGQRIYLRTDLSCGLVDNSEYHPVPEDLNKPAVNEDDHATSKWTVDRFVKECCKVTPEPECVIVGRAEDMDLTSANATRLFKRALGEDKIFQYPGKNNESRRYSTVEPPPMPEVPEKEKRKPGRPRKINNVE